MGYPVHLVSDVTSSSGANDGPRAGSRDAMQSAHQSEDQLRDLMVRYQQGDVAAVETLVTNLSPALLRFCSGPGMSPSDAEDVLQDCWLRIHRARHTYLPSEPLLPWIFAVARHTRLDAYRRRRRL
ncbi:MAG TPA: sigma factor, partial [Candidatus Dormibacteraeota bacterium]|nr:sigma factor [Candidatus Dormibacteraeota bacterium]